MEPPVSARAALLLELDRGPGFGLELIERIRLRCSVELGQGSVYPALASLRRDGYIREVPGPQKVEGRPRRHFEVTPAGRLEAAHIRQTLAALLAGVGPRCGSTFSGLKPRPDSFSPRRSRNRPGFQSKQAYSRLQ